MKKLSLIIWILFTSPLMAATYYVGPSGNDVTGDGSSGNPWRNLQKCATTMVAGDTCIAKDGTYPLYDYYVVETAVNGTAGNLITYRSENKWGATVDMQTSSGAFGFELGGNYTVIQDFIITGGQYENGGSGVQVADGDYVTIVGNKFHTIGYYCTNTAFGQTGIYTTGTVDHLTIDSNVFYNIGRYSNGELGCTPGNTYWQNHDHGIYLNGGSNYVVKNNIFYDMDNGWPIQLYFEAITGLVIANNTFVDPNPNRPGHIIIACNVTTSDIANNISYDPTTGFLDWSSGTMSGVTVRNNLTYGGVIDGATPPGSGVTWSGNIDNTDPLFTNYGTGDYTLQSSSPAKDAGVSQSGIVDDDFNGTARPINVLWDIGAYEREASAAGITSLMLLLGVGSK